MSKAKTREQIESQMAPLQNQWAKLDNDIFLLFDKISYGNVDDDGYYKPLNVTTLTKQFDNLSIKCKEANKLMRTLRNLDRMLQKRA